MQLYPATSGLLLQGGPTHVMAQATGKGSTMLTRLSDRASVQGSWAAMKLKGPDMPLPHVVGLLAMGGWHAGQHSARSPHVTACAAYNEQQLLLCVQLQQVQDTEGFTCCNWAFTRLKCPVLALSSFMDLAGLVAGLASCW